MAEEQDDEERPCLHRMMVELIEHFFAEYPVAPEGADSPGGDEGDEVIVAVAKTVAELTCRQDSAVRQQLIERLTQEIMNYDAEFRRDDAAGGSSSSHARH